MEVFIILLVIVLLYIFATYNSFIKKINKIKQASSGIDIYLTQRFDLIPNLVECVKGYMEHEKKTLIQITKMRASYLETKDLKQGEKLNAQCNNIIAIAEQYPELKANEQFLNLQKNLSKMESQLQAARRIYNAEVNVYNNKVQTFPSNVLAKFFNFEEYDFFEAEKQAKNNIKIEY